MFPSSSHKRKGFPLLKDYFEKGNGEELLIVAGRPPKGECKTTLYVGYCNEMPLLYKACDYTILASSYEPFGMVGPESVANGTPVIFGENIGCCEIIDRKARVTFNVSDAESLASAISQLKASPLTLTPPYTQYLAKKSLASVREHVEEILRRVQLVP